MQNKPTVAQFKAQAHVFKALAHPGRLLMVDELSRGERCVCELAELVGSEMPTVSRHLAQLKNAGIVDDEKRGAQVFYRLVTPCVMNFFQCVSEVRNRTLETEVSGQQ
ncbi:MAG: winged helix-turn-helix transcriptional regulator [Chloroflexi bacterium]|nr:winged helix-turn-helix transcriptional regulator [Chloroflexota bacterium]